ncbi:hypothetical protein ACUXIW_002360 [Ralstonia pickettii]
MLACPAISAPERPERSRLPRASVPGHPASASALQGALECLAARCPQGLNVDRMALQKRAHRWHRSPESDRRSQVSPNLAGTDPTALLQTSSFANPFGIATVCRASIARQIRREPLLHFTMTSSLLIFLIFEHKNLPLATDRSYSISIEKKCNLLIPLFSRINHGRHASPLGNHFIFASHFSIIYFGPRIRSLIRHILVKSFTYRPIKNDGDCFL